MKSINQVIRQYLSRLTIGIVLLVALLINLGISWVFNNYLTQMRNEENKSLSAVVKDALQDNQLDETEGRVLRQRANQSGIHLMVLSASDEMLFDSSLSGNGTKRILLSKKHTVLNLEQLSYIILDVNRENGQFVKLKIGRESGWLISNEELSFIIGTNMIFFIVLIIAALMVWFFSRYLSDKISAPIIEIQRATNIIKNGQYQKVNLLKRDTKELNDLAEAINSLALQLDQQENLRKRLTTDIAHELRSPLAVIRSQIEAMMDKVLEPSEERLGRLNGEIMRVTKLIDDMNELSIVENDLYVLKKEEINLTELIKEAAEDFKVIYEEKELKIDTKLKEDIYIIGDHERMRQVMHNLLSNAYKYTDVGGVEIGMERVEQNIVITIKDTGMGISDKDLPFIFERFYRTDLSRSRKTGGAGIGLAIVKKIVEAHNGKIEVKSSSQRGTTFIIKF